MNKKEIIYMALIFSVMNIIFITIGVVNILDDKAKYIYVDINTGEKIIIDHNNEKTVVIDEKLKLIKESGVLDEFIVTNDTISSGIDVGDIEGIEEQNIENIKQSIQNITEQMTIIEQDTQTVLNDLTVYLDMLNQQLYDLENGNTDEVIPNDIDITSESTDIEAWFESLSDKKRQQIIDQNNIWYPQNTNYEETFGITSHRSSSGPPMMANEGKVVAFSDSSANIGFSTGGAKDISNFRENIRSGYLPSTYDITYEGLFYDYYFGTSDDTLQQSCKNLFCPAYTTTVTYDPFSNEKQYYMSVGLNSNIKESDFERNNLNIVIVLDVSGSMQAPFDRYYYDRISPQHSGIVTKEKEIAPDKGEYKRKMQIATESIVSLTKHLTPEDRLGIVLFNSDSHIARPLSSMVGVDEKQLEQNILDIMHGGGTNMESGITTAQELYNDIPINDYIPNHLRNDKSYDNRIIFLTDAQPNLGTLSNNGFKNLIMNLETDDNIHTTMIGIGVDFNAELVQAMTNEIRGANYYSVHSAEDFKQRLDAEFEYMVTPLVFDLNMILTSGNYVIDSIYGVPGVDNDSFTNSHNIMNVNTLFPSATVDGEVRGGIIILKLSKVGNVTHDNDVTLEVSYLDRDGKLYSERENILMTTISHDTNAIEKGILLVQYADVITSWITEQRLADDNISVIDDNNIWYKDGIYETHETIYDFIEFNGINLSQYERTSLPLVVNDDYRKIFTDFTTYMNDQSVVLGDDMLLQEVEILNLIIATP